MSSTFDIVQSNAYSPETLCAITLSASHECLFFNNPNYCLLYTSPSPRD